MIFHLEKLSSFCEYNQWGKWQGRYELFADRGFLKSKFAPAVGFISSVLRIAKRQPKPKYG